jgi:uncharacterized protein YdiU (UPF0061 family)
VRNLKEASPSTPMVIVSSRLDLRTAVEAMRVGVADSQYDDLDIREFAGTLAGLLGVPQEQFLAEDERKSLSSLFAAAANPGAVHKPRPRNEALLQTGLSPEQMEAFRSEASTMLRNLQDERGGLKTKEAELVRRQRELEGAQELWKARQAEIQHSEKQAAERLAALKDEEQALMLRRQLADKVAQLSVDYKNLSHSATACRRRANAQAEVEALAPSRTPSPQASRRPSPPWPSSPARPPNCRQSAAPMRSSLGS